MREPELKPCPFCGNKEVGNSGDEDLWWVSCDDCGCLGPESFKNPKHGRRLWNKRQGSEATP